MREKVDHRPEEKLNLFRLGEPEILSEPTDHVAVDNKFFIGATCYMSRKRLSAILHLHEDTVKNRIEIHNIEGITPVNRNHPFYPFKPVVKACRDIREKKPRPVEGFTEDEEGEEIGTIGAYADRLEVDYDTVKERLLKDPAVVWIQGKSNKLCTLVRKKDVYRCCADYLEGLDRADAKGFIYAENGERYGTLAAWCRWFEVDYKTLTSEFGENINNVKTKKGLTDGGPATFYAESDIKKYCARVIDKSNKVKKDGFLYDKDYPEWRYGSQRTLAESVGVTRPRIKRAFRKTVFLPIAGKSKNSEDCFLYAEKILIDLISQEDRNGVIRIFNQDYLRIGPLRKLCDFDKNTLMEAVERLDIKVVRAKHPNHNSSYNYYPIKFIKAIANNERINTIEDWSDILNLPLKIVDDIIKKNKVKGIKTNNDNSFVYTESDIGDYGIEVEGENGINTPFATWVELENFDFETMISCLKKSKNLFNKNLRVSEENLGLLIANWEEEQIALMRKLYKTFKRRTINDKSINNGRPVIEIPREYTGIYKYIERSLVNFRTPNSEELIVMTPDGLTFLVIEEGKLI